MDSNTILNLLSAVCRISNLDPKVVADAFNEREKNQEWFDELVKQQQLGDVLDVNKRTS